MGQDTISITWSNSGQRGMAFREYDRCTGERSTYSDLEALAVQCVVFNKERKFRWSFTARIPTGKKLGRAYARRQIRAE